MTPERNLLICDLPGACGVHRHSEFAEITKTLNAVVAAGPTEGYTGTA